MAFHPQYAAEEAARRAEREKEEAERRKREKAEKAARAAAFEEADWIKASEAEAAALLVGEGIGHGGIHIAGPDGWGGTSSVTEHIRHACTTVAGIRASLLETMHRLISTTAILCAPSVSSTADVFNLSAAVSQAGYCVSALALTGGGRGG